ncbi:hypothetical protein [Acinetobacter defluvii]|uniref:hypothetical protein n=1 Tax=Acinetobacter defluvii TaxID=1871111 RepID=UPI003AF52797
MQYRVLLCVLSCGICFVEQSVACMPHSPDDVFIARFQAAHAAQEQNSQFMIELSSDQFIFRSLFDEFRYTRPTQWYSTFSTESVVKNSLIIGLAYTPDGGKPTQYQIASFAMLNCENDRLIIANPIVPFLAWNKQTSNCAVGNRKTVGILDGFLEHNQSYYLVKLQQKYPTCQHLNTAFSTMGIHDIQHTEDLFSAFKSRWEKLLNYFKSWS